MAQLVKSPPPIEKKKKLFWWFYMLHKVKWYDFFYTVENIYT